MKEINVILTTKNRLNFFERAFNSIIDNIYNLKNMNIYIYIYIVSNSSSLNSLKEKKIIKKFNNNVSYINTIESFSSSFNQAKSINFAISQIVQKNIKNLDLNFDNKYLALLDDDDYWDKDYLLNIIKNTKNNDLILSGINYIQDNQKTKLTINETNIKIENFLWNNPGIQNSNIFIKLSTFLKSGLFDQFLDSCIDRDFIIRLLEQKPKIKILNKYLVNIDASNKRKRITNNREKKLNGLSKFYFKWNYLMSKKIKEKFFERNSKLFNVSKNEIISYINQNIIENKTNHNNIKKNHISQQKDFRLTISFIISNFNFANRLLDSIKKYTFINGIKNIQLIVLMNIKNESLIQKLISKIKSITHYFKIINKYLINSFIKEKNIVIKNNTNIHINSISIARNLLHTITNWYTNKDDVIWIIDEDMIFEEIKKGTKNFFIDYPDLLDVIKKNKKYDVLIGKYTNDPGVPYLSLLKLQLQDFIYGKYIKSFWFEKTKENFFYSIDINNDFLEFFFPTFAKSIEDIFSGVSNSRKIFIANDKSSKVINRGGNTIILNKEILQNEQISLEINNQKLRRGDFLWILLNMEQYKIKSIPFGLLHKREPINFDYNEEISKLWQDTMGYSINLSYKLGLKSIKKFRENVQYFYLNRISMLIINFYRIYGLLTLINDKKYIDLFGHLKINQFAKKSLNFLKNEEIDLVFFHLKKYKSNKNMNFNFGDNLIFIGKGNEGCIFKDKENKYIYKYFYKKLNNKKSLLKANIFLKNSIHFYDLKIIKNNIIKYEFEKSKKYDFNENYRNSIIQMAIFCKKNNISLSNIKPDNFIDVNGILKYIDYGNGISIDKDLNTLKRFYELTKFKIQSNDDFSQIIQNSYNNKEDKKVLENGFDDFNKFALEEITKEDLHDKFIIKKIGDKFKNKKLLDYGSGKCKIINNFSHQNETHVFDIDLKTVEERSKNNKIHYSVATIPDNYFDVIICNLVLCCVDNKTCNEIFKNLKNKIKNKNGKLIISICNPFTNICPNTCLRINNIFDYSKVQEFYKECKNFTPKRKEFHRPFTYYEKLFNKFGFSIIEIIETDGYDFNNLIKIPEQLVFVLSNKKQNNKKINIKNTISIDLNGFSTFSHLYRFIKSFKLQKQNKLALNFKINKKNKINKCFYDYLSILNKYDKKLKDKIFINKKITQKNIYLIGKNGFFADSNTLIKIQSALSTHKKIYLKQFDNLKPLTTTNKILVYKNDNNKLDSLIIDKWWIEN